MAQFRNISNSPWRRADGSLVPPGEVFEATPREARRFAAHRAEERGVIEQVGAPATPLPRPTEWPLRMSPELYLELYPVGPHAPRARILTGSAA